ncbi:UDP-N-acetylmuramyl-tripeptide synthetase [Candidatus Dojkabacteria bacterium]|uniref:UDP-N-acetylmuramyl-tripeptide synthetase n=1 Tax=Candidatus Dojkabacteria bacterium TaxID=2099670 RepID=A0A955L4J4_9BACT|nr:UDP-N-acetylmuramyl-tripeptide synthetase [Candidatus Dojkabacteria bacterium]
MTQDNPIQKAKNLVHKIQARNAHKKYNYPTKELKIIAVTGSDGKTTTTSMIYHVLKSAGLKVAYLSTIEARIGDEVLDTGLHVTTPDPWDVPRYLRMMVDKGIEYVVLESTSNGLQQGRLETIEFDAATITNIREDHLDYHGTWENYAEAKYMVIQKLKKDAPAILNGDDEKSANWLKNKLSLENPSKNVKWYQKNEVTNLVESVRGIGFEYEGMKYHIPIIGSYNLENALAVINVCTNFISKEEISNALKSYSTPKGRMEIIQTEPYTIIIDFAHTPNALENALKSVLNILEPGSNLISVFGCAGMRDKSRRKMGEISAKFASITVLTAEDPRDEKLKKVNNEILKHAKEADGELVDRFADHKDFSEIDYAKIKHKLEKAVEKGVKPFFAFDEDNVASRQDAIEFALRLAKEKDIVFITGKAHEQSLAFGKKQIEYPWSDHDAVNLALKNIK